MDEFLNSTLSKRFRTIDEPTQEASLTSKQKEIRRRTMGFVELANIHVEQEIPEVAKKERRKSMRLLQAPRPFPQEEIVVVKNKEDRRKSTGSSRIKAEVVQPKALLKVQHEEEVKPKLQKRKSRKSVKKPEPAASADENNNAEAPKSASGQRFLDFLFAKSSAKPDPVQLFNSPPMQKNKRILAMRITTDGKREYLVEYD